MRFLSLIVLIILSILVAACGPACEHAVTGTLDRERMLAVARAAHAQL